MERQEYKIPAFNRRPYFSNFRNFDFYRGAAIILLFLKSDKRFLYERQQIKLEYHSFFRLGHY